MNTFKNYALGILCVVLLGVGALLWSEHATVADLAKKVAAANNARDQAEASRPSPKNASAERVQQLEQQIQQLEQRAQAAEARNHELQSQLADAQQIAAAAKTAPAPTAQPVPPGQADTAMAQAARLRVKMEQRYGNLAETLGLTPAQTDQFMKLLVDKRLAAIDATGAALQEGGGTANDPGAFAVLVANSKNDIENQIQTLLGDAGYAQYQQWDRMAGQSGTIASLQAALVSSEPLSNQQMAQLQQLLDNSHAGHLTVPVLANAQAQGFLSPAQLQALQNLYQEQQAAMQRRRAPQNATPPAGGN